MANQDRMSRVRAEREESIIQSARELAEAEGWDAVTTRKLAERIGYSQPVLYTHFRGKDEIIAAVALAGFDYLAERLKATINPKGATRRSLTALVAAYVEFAEANPAVYDAMFSLARLPFGRDDTPASLRAGFDALRTALLPQNSRTADPDIFVEICWASLHGLVTLERAGRLPAATHRKRMAALVDQFAAAAL